MFDKALVPQDKATSLFENQEWLSTVEAAAYLRLSVGSLRNMTSNGQIPYYKLGGRNRYRLVDLRELPCKKGDSHGN
jgi:excisionase family DNA binding protein